MKTEYSDLPTDLKAKYALADQSETRVLGFTRRPDSGVYGVTH